MANNYNIMADHIVSKYIKRISGEDIEETFVDYAPDKRVMAGKLAENRIDENFTSGYTENNNTRFESVPSISISFIVKKNPSGIINVIPRGLMFYTVKPDYEKTVDYILQKYSEKDNVKYTHVQELCNCYPEKKFYVPLTYKKVSIEDEIGDGISIRLDSIKKKSFHLEDEINDRLQHLVSRITNEICITQSDRITFFDLLDEKRFKTVVGQKDERAMPRWRMDIYCNIIDERDNYRFILQLVNKTPVNEKSNVGYLPQFFNSGMKIVGNDSIEFVDIKLDYFKNSYKNRQLVYAVTENTAAVFDEKENTIYTDNIPKYYQMRLKTKDYYNQYVTFDKLITDPIGNLLVIYKAMTEDYKKCYQEYLTSSFSNKIAKTRFKEDIDEYEREISRFKKGIEQIEYKDFVKKAFIYMNKTFETKLEGEHRKKYKGGVCFRSYLLFL